MPAGSKLPEKFEDWRWPWKQGEVDEEKAAKLIFDTRKEREKLQDENASLKTSLADVEKERDEAKQNLDSKSSSDTEKDVEIATLKKQVTELEKVGKAPRPEDEARIARLEVAMDLGLTKTQAKRLQGTTREEIEADAKELAADLGIELDGDEGDEPPAGGKPQDRVGGQFISGGNLRNGGGDKGGAVLSAAQLLANDGIKV